MKRAPLLTALEILVWLGFGFGLIAPLFTSSDESEAIAPSVSVSSPVRALDNG